MTKPLHVGRAAENGVTAALLAARGFTADPEALDGPWGFYAVHGGGVTPEKSAQGFGKVFHAVRNDHKLLNVDVVVGMGAAV